VTGCERLRDELAADAAGRAENGELHVGAGLSNAGIPSAIGSIAALEAAALPRCCLLWHHGCHAA
jgi:hypothetical protein